MTVLYTAVSGVNQTETVGLSASSGGWVSGTIASLAISTLATVVFDLGSGWKSLGTVIVAGANMTASTSTAVSASFASDAAGTDATSAMTPYTATSAFAYSGTSVGLTFQLMVTNRYLRVAFTNGSSAVQGATAKIVVAGSDQ